MRTIMFYSDGSHLIWELTELNLFVKRYIMNKLEMPEIKEVMEALHYRPAVSIIMPFEPKMTSKNELAYSLEMAVHKVQEELIENYSEEIEVLVIHKLKAVIKNLNFNTHKESIAIYVSPVFEKVLYLDVPVEKKIIVDESFEIRDLVYSKKQVHKYLLLQLSSKGGNMYIGNSETFIKIVSATPTSVFFGTSEVREKDSDFSGKRERREIIMDQLIHYVDKTLGIILNSYHLPLFVMGGENILGHFKKNTKYSSSVIEYVPGNYEEATLPELKEILQPYLSDWKKVIQKDLINQMEKAADKSKLVVGMKDVWCEAMGRKGKLLLIEKNYTYAAERGSCDEIIYKAIEPFNKFSYIKDAVDDVIEKVLENGGDVEFVDEGFLKDYQHIALIKYY